jgi:hypothetical protein
MQASAVYDSSQVNASPGPGSVDGKLLEAVAAHLVLLFAMVAHKKDKTPRGLEHDDHMNGKSGNSS